MNYKNIIKKQSFIITASIVVMAIILIGTSYAIFNNTDNSDVQVLSSGTLQISYSGSTITTLGGTNGSGELVESEPIDEDVVDTQQPYKIEVSNNGTLALRYNIFIYTDASNTLPHKYFSIKYKENGSYTSKVALTTLTKENPSITEMNSIRYKLSSTPFVVAPGEVKTHELYLWIDEDSSDEGLSNTVANVKIKVEGEATENN